MPRTGGGQDLLAAGDRVIQHAAGVLADGVVDLRRRNAVAILQHRIERDPVMLLRQILADADRHAVTDQAAERIVMALAPGQRPLASAFTASVPTPMARLNWKV